MPTYIVTSVYQKKIYVEGHSHSIDATSILTIHDVKGLPIYKFKTWHNLEIKR